MKKVIEREELKAKVRLTLEEFDFESIWSDEGADQLDNLIVDLILETIEDK